MPERVAPRGRRPAPRGLGRYGNGSTVTERTIPTLVPDDDRAAAVAQRRAAHLHRPGRRLQRLLPQPGLRAVHPVRPHRRAVAGRREPLDGRAASPRTYDFTAWFTTDPRALPGHRRLRRPAGRPLGRQRGGHRPGDGVERHPGTADPTTAHSDGRCCRNGSAAADIGSRAKLLAPTDQVPPVVPGRGRRLAAARLVLPPRRTAQDAERSWWTSTRGPSGATRSLLLNVPPARDGRIAAEDVASLTAFGAAVRETYGRDLRLPDPGPGPSTGSASPRTSGTVSGWSGSPYRRGPAATWTTIAEGTTIGHRRILALPAPVTADAVRVAVAGVPRAGPSRSR